MLVYCVVVYALVGCVMLVFSAVGSDDHDNKPSDRSALRKAARARLFWLLFFLVSPVMLPASIVYHIICWLGRNIRDAIYD